MVISEAVTPGPVSTPGWVTGVELVELLVELLVVDEAVAAGSASAAVAVASGELPDVALSGPVHPASPMANAASSATGRRDRVMGQR